MAPERVLELLKIEHSCMLRKSHGDCDSECGLCNLAHDDHELHEMYTSAMNYIRLHIPVQIADIKEPGKPMGRWRNNAWTGKCPNCKRKISGRTFTRYCKHCGKAVRWDEHS